MDSLFVVCLCSVESNSARLIGMGGVPLLLTHHTDWHNGDGKNRYISLRKAVLNTLKNITNLSQYTLLILWITSRHMFYGSYVQHARSLTFFFSQFPRGSRTNIVKFTIRRKNKTQHDSGFCLGLLGFRLHQPLYGHTQKEL